MAIRFHCTLCGRPIEIDDEWADKPVACPFCQSTVTAPSVSTIADESVDPEGSISNSDGVSLTDDGSHVGPTVSTTGNAAAIISLILAVMAIGMFIATDVVKTQNAKEFEAYSNEVEKLMTETDSIFEAITKSMESNGGQLPSWLMLISLLQMGVLACVVVGSICAIIALRKRTRRTMAACSLAIYGCSILLLCSGIVG